MNGLNLPYMDLDQAFSFLKEGNRVVTGMSPSEPKMFFSHLHHKKNLRSLEVFCANPSEIYPCFTDNLEFPGLIISAMFLTSKVRDQGLKRVFYVPQHLSQWSNNISNKGPVDVFWGTCSPPDKRGFVSLGPNCCYESEIFRTAKIRILEVNQNIPVTFGATTVPVGDVDAFIESDASLPSITPAEPDEIDHKVGEFVADLVKDESTLQLGIGSIPNAIGKALDDKKNLGVHTEMMNDTMMTLFEKGVITNKAKTTWPGKIVASFIFGSKDLYRFVHSNPVIELQPASILNDPYRIGKNHRMTSINSAVEIDITGQVCSESLGHKELSGVGGASETHMGAQRSIGGRGIIAMKSKTSKGLSKINFELLPGAKVSISRNDIDTIVTEHGVASLKGRSVRQRAYSLISIASPEFREKLTFDAKNAGYI